MGAGYTVDRGLFSTSNDDNYCKASTKEPTMTMRKLRRVAVAKAWHFFISTHRPIMTLSRQGISSIASGGSKQLRSFNGF